MQASQKTVFLELKKTKLLLAVIHDLAALSTELESYRSVSKLFVPYARSRHSHCQAGESAASEHRNRAEPAARGGLKAFWKSQMLCGWKIKRVHERTQYLY